MDGTNGNKLRLGNWVRSHFRAPWKGMIVGDGHVDNCVYVLVVIDRHDNLIPKPFITHLNIAWLTKVPEPSNEVCEHARKRMSPGLTQKIHKLSKGTIWRSPPTKKRPRGERWYFIAEVGRMGWMMARVRDGYRLFVDPKHLTIET